MCSSRHGTDDYTKDQYLRIDTIPIEVIMAHKDNSPLSLTQLNNTTIGHDNCSLSNAPKFDDTVTVKVVALGIVFIVALVGNVLTVYQSCRSKHKTTVNKLILQLAISDLIVAFFSIFAEIIWSITVEWLAGSLLCKMLKYMQIFGWYLSTYITVVISIDRCFAILDPMSRRKSPQRVKCMIIVSWILSILFSSPQAVIFRVRRGPFIQEFYQCVHHGSYTAVWQKKLYSTFSLLLMFIIPLSIMVVAYGLIFYTIVKKSRSYGDSDARNDTSGAFHGRARSQLLQRAKKKSLRITAIIVLAFIICWTPYYGTFIVFSYFDKTEINSTLFLIFYLMSLCNAMIHPLIYGAFHMCTANNQRSRDGVILSAQGRCSPAGKSRSQVLNTVFVRPEYQMSDDHRANYRDSSKPSVRRSSATPSYM